MNQVKSITTELAAELLRSTNGKIFSVRFKKRDGTLRDMTARLGVKSHLKGGNKPYSDSENDLLTVFDMSIKQYRSVPLYDVLSVKFDGAEWIVV